jgi:hypothetical protein
MLINKELILSQAISQYIGAFQDFDKKNPSTTRGIFSS